MAGDVNNARLPPGQVRVVMDRCRDEKARNVEIGGSFHLKLIITKTTEDISKHGGAKEVRDHQSLPW